MPLKECDWLTSCPFFDDPVGYSPELGTLLVERFCRREYHGCDRRIYRTIVGASAVPDAMLPTDYEELETVLLAWKAAHPA